MTADQLLPADLPNKSHAAAEVCLCPNKVFGTVGRTPLGSILKLAGKGRLMVEDKELLFWDLIPYVISVKKSH